MRSALLITFALFKMFLALPYAESTQALKVLVCVKPVPTGGAAR
jgi:hypothetical protein